MRLLYEKIKTAILKRSKHKPQKSYEAWLAKGYDDTPEVTVVIQSHNKSVQVCHILPKLRSWGKALEIIVIDDGSSPEHTARLAKALTGANEFLLRANDLYENRTYDRAIRMANGRYIALLQDDDDFKDTGWIDKAIELFGQHPQMVILGGKWGLTVSFDAATQSGCGKRQDMGGAAFQFVDAVNRAPMWIRKDLYEQHLHRIDFRLAPSQYDDDELCLRSWLCGLQVGWYDAGFFSLSAGGMRLWNSAFTNQQMERNGKLLYQQYADKLADIKERVAKSNG